MSEIIMLTNTRLSFPQLVEPKAFMEGGTKKYSADLIIDPASDDWKKVMAQVMKVAQEKWNDQAQQILQFVQSDRKLRCYGMGQEKVNSKTLQVYEGYMGMAYLTTSNANMPQMIETSGKAVDPTNTMAYQALARKLYGGARVNAAVKIWPQQNQFGRGIRCELVALQFAKDDEPFGDGSTDVSSMFNPVAAAPAAGATPAGIAFPSFLM